MDDAILLVMWLLSISMAAHISNMTTYDILPRENISLLLRILTCIYVLPIELPFAPLELRLLLTSSKWRHDRSFNVKHYRFCKTDTLTTITFTYIFLTVGIRNRGSIKGGHYEGSRSGFGRHVSRTTESRFCLKCDFPRFHCKHYSNIWRTLDTDADTFCRPYAKVRKRKRKNYTIWP